MIRVEVVYARPESQQMCELSIEPGTTARSALQKAVSCGMLDIDHSIAADSVPLGVFGQLVDDAYQLADKDRVEILRPLLQDPMQRRRRRAKDS
ncbi:MAG: RnfH family protein [Granulosicoccus sp.]